MAKADFKGALGVEKIKEFGGICHGGSNIGERKEEGSFNAFDICNFRILPDGSLQKREGFAPIMNLPDQPRAFWCGCIDGDEMAFALVGSAVYSVDLDSGTSTLFGSVSTSEGGADFFFYHGTLYLVDGQDFYRYDGEEFTSFSGYVPMFAKDIDGINGFEICEPVNYLSDKIRIHYKLEEALLRIYIGVACSEILSFKCNGRDMLSIVSLSEDGRYITTPNAVAEKADVEVCLRLAESECRRNELLGVTRATLCGDGDDGKILLYGGGNRSDVFASRNVPSASYRESVAADEGSNDIYFPVTDRISVTDGRYHVSSVCRQNKSVLIFTERETWRASFSEDYEPPRMEIADRNVGCVSELGSTVCGNIPFAVSHDGIYRFDGQSGAECISGDIYDMLDDSFYAHAVAFYDHTRGEAIFADPDSDEQDVFVYSVPGKRWYRFDGIPVDSFFSYRGRVCMLYGKYLFSFEEDALADTSAEWAVQSNIEAYYESNLTDFGYPEREKHLGRVLLKADCGGDSLYITLEGDNCISRTIEIKDVGDGLGKYPTHFGTRTGIGRFREMNYVIRSDSEARPRVMGLTLSALK